MKRLLLPLLAALALSTAVNAGVDSEVHNLCKDVSDYMGCVKANSDNKLSIKSVEKTEPKKQRPAWMVQKLKGCFKYADATKKNYCIKTYSPYGNPIPEKLTPTKLIVTDEKFKLGEMQKKFCNLEYDYDVQNCIKFTEKLGSKIFNVSITNHKECVTLLALKDYISCLEKKGEKVTYFRNTSGEEKERDSILFKDRIYTASRTCPAGENMYWGYSSGFMRKTKVKEIGCMTSSENEEYWRNMELGKAGAPKGGGGSGAAARMDMETKMRWNNINQNYRNDFKNWQMKEFGY